MWDSSSGSPVLSLSASLVIFVAYSAAPSSSARGLKAAANARSGVGPRPQGQDIPEPVALAPQGRQQAGIDQRRLAAAGSAHHHHERMLADLAHQLADGALRIVGAAAAEEERRVLFPECVEPSVGADGFPRHFRRRSARRGWPSGGARARPAHRTLSRRERSRSR